MVVFKKYRVIIVGGGPAGSLTAIRLADIRPDIAGDILVLEAKDFPREKICGGGVAGRVTSSLERAGIALPDTPSVPLEGMKVYYGDRFHFSAFTSGGSRVVRRSLFDDSLLEKAGKMGVEVRTRTPVDGAWRDDSSVTVTTRDGRRFSGEILVGADGVNGKSRYWFGIPDHSPRQFLLQADLPGPEGSNPTGGSLVIDFTPIRLGCPGYAWFFPSVDSVGRPVLNSGITGGSYRRGVADFLKSTFRDVLQRHPECASLDPMKIRFRPYPERSYSPFKDFTAERFILVGEQLGVDPLTGEGLGICADSSEVAAREISRALQAGDYSFRGYRPGMVRTGSSYLWIAGAVFSRLRTEKRFSALYSLITREYCGEKRCYLDYYCDVFDGARQPPGLYGRQAITALARGIAGNIGRLRKNGPRSA